MPRKVRCCVGECQNSRQDAILYKFPIQEKRLSVWLQSVRDVCDISVIKPGVSVVCSKHFERRFVTSKFNLKVDAYPSLFADDEIESGQPTVKIPEYNLDHTYSRKRHYDHTYSKLENNKAPDASGPSVSNLHEIPHPTSHMTLCPNQLPLSNIPEIMSKTPADIESAPTGLEEVSTRKTSKGRQRLISKMSQLTPLTKRIYAEYKKAKKQMNFHKRAKNALKFCRESSFETLTTNMNPYAKQILKMQISMCTKKKNARRFTTEDKVLALSIMKQSPKCYRFLRKIFILPSKTTLNQFVMKFKVEPGINPLVFNLLKKEVDSWDEKKKMCSIIFDEMSLDTALTYEKNRDYIQGFVELLNKKGEFADHALVFMLRGAVYKWQQPLCFYFCQGATNAAEIKNILRQLVESVIALGLKPIALVSDQGAAFQSALNSLQKETERAQILNNENPDGTIMIGGANLSIIFDPSHLIKGLRNNFLTKNIKMDGKISKWQDIIEVYETDCQHTESRLLHKLNDQCVMPEKIKKMKVKNCVKVLSRTMSAALEFSASFATYVDGRPVSATIKNTASTVLFFDRLFDSINGASINSKKNRGKELRKAVTNNSKHHQFWPEAIKILEKLKFIDRNGREKSVPSVKNFITTIKSYMRLWQLFVQMNINIMRPRYFNSDPIENFFGQVRAYNYRNNDPNCHSFSCTFKSLLVTRLIQQFHSDSFNCEDDSAEQAVNINILIEEESNIQPGHPYNMENVMQQARRERLNTHSRAYTAGWVVGKILKGHDCRECQASLTSSVSLGIHDWISHREFCTTQRKRLKYPSEGAVRCFSTVIRETNEYLEKNAHENKISNKIKEHVFSKYSFEFLHCAEHRQSLLNEFISVTVRFTIFNWCNTINKILKGTDVIRLMRRTNLPNMQKKALEKYKKKLKNKSFNK